MNKEIVDIKTVAARLGYSVHYVSHHWPQLLQGVKPLKLGPGRNIRFYWQDVQALLESPK
jgi:predicted DNA-binding transcriptional regulator AlpA